MPRLTQIGSALAGAILLGLSLASPAMAAPRSPKPAEPAPTRPAATTPAPTTAAPTGAAQAGTASATTQAEPSRSAERARGEALAATAQKLVGHRYAWGGASPATGFDCSGLVMYVHSTASLTAGRLLEDQLAVGQRIARDALLPGDIVLFQNTYKAGPSHSGVYVGDGGFVHAVDESRGVAVSDLSDSYWGPRYYAAARPASKP